MTQQLLTLSCPFCNDSTVVRHGLDNSQTKQRYICRNPECGRNFFVTLTDTPQIVIPKRRVRKAIQVPKPTVESDVKCPTCGSINLRKNGKVSHDRQRFLCKVCKCNFRVGTLTKRGQAKAEIRETSRQLMAENRVTHMSRLGVNSLVGVTCFLCPDQAKCDEGNVSVNPITCVRLAESFGIPPIHEYVPTNQVFLTDSEIEEGNTQHRKEDL